MSDVSFCGLGAGSTLLSGGYDIVKSLHNESSAESGAESGAEPGSAHALEKLFALAVVTHQYMERGLAARGLSRARATVLWNLHHRGPMTQRSLAEAIRV